MELLDDFFHQLESLPPLQALKVTSMLFAEIARQTDSQGLREFAERSQTTVEGLSRLELTAGPLERRQAAILAQDAINIDLVVLRRIVDAIPADEAQMLLNDSFAAQIGRMKDGVPQPD